MTAAWPGSPRAVHILGYFLDVTNAKLQAALQRAQTLMASHVDLVLEAIRNVGGKLERADLDRYRHRYAGGAALVLGMLEHGVLRGAPPGLACGCCAWRPPSRARIRSARPSS